MSAFGKDYVLDEKDRIVTTPTPTPDGEADFEAADSTAKFWADAEAHGNGVRTLARAYLALRARPLPDDVTQAQGAYEDAYYEWRSERKNVAAGVAVELAIKTEKAWSALLAAVRAECAAKVRSEEMVDDLSDVVDDVNPRKTHTEDIADARIYCEFIAERIAELERRLAAKDAHIERIVKAAKDNDEYWAKRFALARVEGAREALTAFVVANRAEFGRASGTANRVEAFRDREYPATGEEPTRDALHAETLRMLEGPFNASTRLPDLQRQVAYAAECVKRVPELEAEVERLRAKAAIVDVMERGEIRVSSSGTHGWSVQAVREGDEAGPSNRWHTAPTLLAAYAAAAREGTDA